MTPRLSTSINELNAGARRPAYVPPCAPKKIGILGAGFMGAGIATVSALASLDVVLIDQTQALAEAGKAICAASIEAHILKNGATDIDTHTVLSHISASADYADLTTCDLVIETIFEDRAAKADAIRKAEALLAPAAIFATNTSTFPITTLAEASQRPSDFIGVHFFSPVEKMNLVELIRGTATSDPALAIAFDYVRAIGKTPIVVNDGYAFFANRCVNHYLCEGHLMLLEGIPPELIDSSAKDAGMPVGPLALSDEVGIDLVYKILLATKQDLGSQAIDSRQEGLLKTMTVTHRRLGRKNRRGFYEYPEGQPKTLWPGLFDMAPVRHDAKTIDVEGLQARFLIIQTLQAIHAIEDDIVTDPREADAGSVLGFGFPASTGGVLSYADGIGTAVFLERCEKLMQSHGERFSPPRLLRDLAKAGESFYGTFAGKVRA